MVVAVQQYREAHVWLFAVSAALLSALFFGLNPVAAKILFAPTSAARFDATSLFIARGFWAAPLFLGLAFMTRPRPMLKLSPTNARLFVVCGVAYGPGANVLSALGAGATSASHAVLLLSLFPPLAAVMASILLREHLAPLRVIAIIVGIVGAASLTLSRSTSGSTVFGDALIAAFILAWAFLTLGVRKLASTYPALFVVGVFGSIGSVLLTLIGLPLGRINAILIPLHHRDWSTFIWFDVEIVLLLSLAGQLLQAVALRTLNVAVVAALTSYGSITAGVVASIVLLGEHMSIGEAVAGVFLFTALGLSLVPVSMFSRKHDAEA